MLHLDTLMTLAIAAGLGTLLAAVIEIFGAARRATAAGSTGRLPGWALLAISIVFAAVMAWLWLPLPVRLGLAPRSLGALLYFVGLALSLWGRLALAACSPLRRGPRRTCLCNRA